MARSNHYTTAALIYNLEHDDKRTNELNETRYNVILHNFCEQRLSILNLSKFDQNVFVEAKSEYVLLLHKLLH